MQTLSIENDLCFLSRTHIKCIKGILRSISPKFLFKNRFVGENCFLKIVIVFKHSLLYSRLKILFKISCLQDTLPFQKILTLVKVSNAVDFLLYMVRRLQLLLKNKNQIPVFQTAVQVS